MNKETEQQEKNRLIVSRDVLCCVSQEVEFILNQCKCVDKPFSYDDAENLYYTFEEAREYGIVDEKCLEAEFEPELKEVYEWWKVSSLLLDKLAEQGEVVIRDFNLWGRGTTGQSIILDSVITEIQRESDAK